MLHRLAAVLTNIGNNAITVLKSALLGNFGNCLKNSGDLVAVLRRYGVGGRNVLLGELKVVLLKKKVITHWFLI